MPSSLSPDELDADTRALYDQAVAFLPDAEAWTKGEFESLGESEALESGTKHFTSVAQDGVTFTLTDADDRTVTYASGEFTTLYALTEDQVEAEGFVDDMQALHPAIVAWLEDSSGRMPGFRLEESEAFLFGTGADDEAMPEVTVPIHGAWQSSGSFASSWETDQDFKVTFTDEATANRADLDKDGATYSKQISITG